MFRVENSLNPPPPPIQSPTTLVINSIMLAIIIQGNWGIDGIANHSTDPKIAAKVAALNPAETQVFENVLNATRQEMGTNPQYAHLPALIQELGKERGEAFLMSFVYRVAKGEN